jgi:hypothetical protein
VTINSANDVKTWKPVKARIVGSRFGTISGLAAHLRCHPNAIRLAAAGQCPRVRAKLITLGLL